MFLPVSTGWTSISSRPTYTKTHMAVAAHALKSVYLLCARFLWETATKAVLKTLHLVLQKGDKWLLPIQWWAIQSRTLGSTYLDQCLVLLGYLQGLIFVSCYIHTNLSVFFVASGLLHQEQFRQHNSWEICGVGILLMMAFDIDLFCVAILTS